jgi:tungstate transport system ATP-binding protein
MTSLLELQDVTRRYGKVDALAGASLKVDRGQIVGLLGPSGAGKTTLLRLAGLLEAPTSGNVVFDGRTAHADDKQSIALRRRMSMILQKPVVFSGSVMRNATYGLRVRGYPEDQARRLVKPVIESVGLSGMADRPAATLSGGEVQRLAFARATVLKPELLLLDEFTANLDPANVALLENGVRRYRDGGGTVLMVTHNLAQGKRLADRVCLLLGGKIAETGPASEFFAGPKTGQAREFLNGTMVW